jgi:SagB-type dehydrogenase family enzyme
MTKTPVNHNKPENIKIVYEYHDQTKHHPQHYARSLGYMDWANQPDPFRYYDQALTLSLEHPSITDTPTYDSLFSKRQAPVLAINRETISHLFYESLAISAWKQADMNRWSLRVNPSSGNLHPTEAYLIAGPIEALSEVAAIYHYSAYKHALERRVILTNDEWHAINKNLPPDSMLLALTSIYWRESWKYGERAFRYCHHDIGHAIGTLTFAAAIHGWKTRLIHSIADDKLKRLLALHEDESNEAEHPYCLLVIYPANENSLTKDPLIALPASLFVRSRSTEYEGHPNALSSTHHDWPIIDIVAEACGYSGNTQLFNHQYSYIDKADNNDRYEDRRVSARKVIRERRSAIDMDGHHHISKETFYRMMTHVSPQPGNKISAVIPWRSEISLILFVHRVDGLSPGLYLFLRDPSHEQSLKKALRSEFCWEKPADCPKFLDLYLLTEADVRNAARMICCHQDIAANGTFALAMLAEFDASIEQYGASFYPRLFWEAGLIGQILYLEAEAAGIRATGIGCFFDDTMHEVLGIRDHAWQSLYHFTMGKPVDDPRLQTHPPYWHLK